MASRGNRHCASCIPMPETFSVLELSCISWAVLYRILSASRVKNDFFIHPGSLHRPQLVSRRDMLYTNQHGRPTLSAYSVGSCRW